MSALFNKSPVRVEEEEDGCGSIEMRGFGAASISSMDGKDGIERLRMEGKAENVS